MRKCPYCGRDVCIGLMCIDCRRKLYAKHDLGKPPNLFTPICILIAMVVLFLWGIGVL